MIPMALQTADLPLRDLLDPLPQDLPQLPAEGGRIRAKLVMSFDVACVNFTNIDEALQEYADSHCIGPAETQFKTALQAGFTTFERHLSLVEDITSRLERTAHEEHVRFHE